MTRELASLVQVRAALRWPSRGGVVSRRFLQVQVTNMQRSVEEKFEALITPTRERLEYMERRLAGVAADPAAGTAPPGK